VAHYDTNIAPHARPVCTALAARSHTVPPALNENVSGRWRCVVLWWWVAGGDGVSHAGVDAGEGALAP
jgi:hypothetical protein